ncbi:NAD(P)/FAD-dependent oxidoreductase [Ornithinimicrobium cerasi]|uniref:Thioredoxin reductase n=1 Tax=Ornithinimicrobium cerasi TaxID=2248773 RepID=A0A285VWB2_9MICO|nr:NAD(P)/FAD-dependent oxidoreductase [Ornithinimicrobium cerasi]SOC58339.1 Thioredoxin reductase [Ornithinimicrobium cerasi]
MSENITRKTGRRSPHGAPADRDVEVVVVGGGPAGLQAALTLGRVHRDVVLVDAGEGRNAPAAHLHNVVTRDGTPPAEFRRIARAELGAYPTVEVRDGRVTRLSATEDASAAEKEVEEKGATEKEVGERGGTAYLVELADGSRLSTAKVVLATGVRDELPDVPGVADLWGDLVAHCPFCHGHEFAGRRVAILGAAPAPHLAALLRPVASEVVVLTHGDAAPEGLPAVVVTDRVTEVTRSGDGALVRLAGGGTLEVAGVFVATTLHQAAPFSEQLGLTANDSGCVRVDERCRTSRPGVYAAGDMAHVESLPMPMTSVAQAIASGSLAGATAAAELIADEQAAVARAG